MGSIDLWHPRDEGAHEHVTDNAGPTATPARVALLARLGGMQGQALAAVVLKAAAAGSAFLLQWLIARMFGAQGAGLYALMATTITLAATVAVMGQDIITLRSVAGDISEGRTGDARAAAHRAVIIATFGAAIGSLAVLIFGFVYAGISGRTEFWLLIVWAVPACAAMTLSRIHGFVARGGGSILSSQLIDGPITSGVAMLILACVALTQLPLPLYSLGAIYAIANLCAFAFAVVISNRIKKGWTSTSKSLAWRPSVRAGAPVMLAQASPFLTDWVIIFVVSALLGATAAGQVRIATLFLSVMYLIAVAFEAVFAPRMAAALRQRDLNRVSRNYRLFVIGTLALNTPFIAVGILAPTLYLDLFGPDFTVIGPAIAFGVSLQVVTLLLGPAGLILILSHNERLVYITNFIGILALIAACTIFIPLYGVTGAVVSVAAILLAKRIAEVVLLRRRLGAFSAQ